MDPIIKAVYCFVLTAKENKHSDKALFIPIVRKEFGKLRKFMLDYHFHKHIKSGKY